MYKTFVFALLIASIVYVRTDDAAYDEESVKAFAKEGNISVSETEAFLEMRKAIKPPTTISKSLEAFDKVCKVFTNSSEELKPRNDWDGTSNALAISRLRIALANKRLDLATRMTNFRNACSEWSYRSTEAPKPYQWPVF